MTRRLWVLDLFAAAVLVALPVVLFAPVLFSGEAAIVGAPGEDGQTLAG